MKIAFSYWGKRIAPVFDTAQEIQVIETESGQIVCRSDEILAEEVPVLKAHHLLALGIGTLVCGAISRPIHSLIAAYGIKVVPFVAGELEDVIWAWLDDQLEVEAFIMPGCWKRGGFRRQLRPKGREERMNGKGRGSEGRRSGKNQRTDQAGRARMDGSGRSGATDHCRCPNCGLSEIHGRGIPCGLKNCPKCGTQMVRQER